MPSIIREDLPKELVLIGERRAVGTGPLIERPYAATGEVIREVHMGSVADLELAVARARATFPEWRAVAPSARRDMLLKAAALLRERTDRLAYLAAIDLGLAVQNVSWFISHAAEWLTYYAGWIDKAAGSVVPTGTGAFDYIRNEPYGVIGVISPSNSAISAMILAPLLAAGNCAVIKPSEFASMLTMEYLQVFLDAGIPPGVLNSVPGGPEIGEALVAHPGIDKIHFTGSCRVGAMVSSLAATKLKPSALELGGKSCNIVFEDADIDIAASIAMRAMVRQSGQSCVAGTRVLVHESIAQRVLDRTIELTRAQKMGDPLLASTAYGPVVSAAARDRIMATIERARQDGDGRVALGGDCPGGALAGGYFINPTIFADVDHHSSIAQEETFGPVISFITFKTEEDAVTMANDSKYGLAAYVQTRDLRRAHEVSERLEVGTIWVNGAVGILAGGPFGGTKESGFGRVGGLEGLREFTRAKNIWMGLI